MLRVEETERVEDIFSRMDSDADGLVTLQDTWLDILTNRDFPEVVFATFGHFRCFSCKNIHPCAGIHRFLFQGLQIVETFNTKYECD